MRKHKLYIVKTRLTARNPEKPHINYKPLTVTGLFEGYSKSEAEKTAMKITKEDIVIKDGSEIIDVKVVSITNALKTTRTNV